MHLLIILLEEECDGDAVGKAQVWIVVWHFPMVLEELEVP